MFSRIQYIRRTTQVKGFEVVSNAMQWGLHVFVWQVVSNAMQWGFSFFFPLFFGFLHVFMTESGFETCFVWDAQVPGTGSKAHLDLECRCCAI